MTLLKFNIDSAFNVVLTIEEPPVASTSSTLLRFNIGSKFNVAGVAPQEPLPTVSTTMLRFNIGSRFNIIDSAVESVIASPDYIYMSAETGWDLPSYQFHCPGIEAGQTSEGYVITDFSGYVRIAAYNAPTTDKLAADYICTGVDDQNVFGQAIMENRGEANLTLKLSRGLFNLTDFLNIKDVSIIGEGPALTTIEFIKPGLTSYTMYDAEIGIIATTTGTTTFNGFKLSANGTLKVIYDDPTVFSNPEHTNKYVISNIEATNYSHGSNTYYRNNTPAKIMIEVAYPVNTTAPITIPLVYLDVINCYIHDTDFSGLMIYGDKSNDMLARAMKDIYMENCVARTCGMQENGKVVAGFHLLTNVTTENIRMQNCISIDNWHCGFYYDDARIRLFSAAGRTDYTSNMVYNLYMDNCSAYSNGLRSKARVTPELLPYCSGFVLREYGMGSDAATAVPQFYSYDTDGTIIYQTRTYPAYLGDARGPYLAVDPTKVAYGNVVNCITSNNAYAGFYSKGYNWNAAQLTLLNCRATGDMYAFVTHGHEGLHIVNFISDGIISPAAILNNIDYVTVTHMKIVNVEGPSDMTFSGMDEYELLPVAMSRFFEVVG